MEEKSSNDTKNKCELNDTTIVEILDSNDEHESCEIVLEKEEGEVGEDDSDAEQELFEIKFKNSEIFDSLHEKIIHVLQNYFETEEKNIFCDVKQLESSLVVLRVNGPMPMPMPEQATCSKTPKPQSREQSPDLTGIAELFKIDAEPSEIPDFKNVPSYKRSVKNMLDERTKEENTPDNDKCARRGHMCFNCGNDDHSLQDCTQPRNAKRINNARRNLKRGNDQRYHKQTEQKYTHLQPGIISSTLKNAMGLGKGEIPFFNYRMRLLGYPPGWLEDAKVTHSGLTLITSDTNSVQNSELTNNGPDKYDVSKIIDFPGYNVKPTKFYDEYKYFNVPPMNEYDMKEEFIKRLGNNVVKAYKRKKLTNMPDNENGIEENKSVVLECTDMEIEDETEITTPVSSKNQKSPTLKDLETQQEHLLHALNIDKSVQKTDCTLDNSLVETETENIEIKDIQTPTLQAPTTPTTPLTPIIKESHVGTPLLKFSPFDSLPSGENFKKGVSDVINFENLPDSTGKYEKMKGVIKKVRNIVTQLNNDDDE